MQIIKTGLGPIKMKWVGEDSDSELPVVYIGGAFQTVQSMEGLFKDVIKRTRMLLIEAPGYSDVPLSHEVPFKKISEEVINVLSSLNLGRFNMIGASYGGLIAIYASHSNKLNINKLMLGGFGYFSKLTRYGLAKSVELIEMGKTEEGVGIFRGLVLNNEQKEKINRFKDIQRRVELMLGSMSLMQVKCYSENTTRLLNIADQ
jgi:pimeloyl-ACP methyl ester carboxylesterase